MALKLREEGIMSHLKCSDCLDASGALELQVEMLFMPMPLVFTFRKPSVAVNARGSPLIARLLVISGTHDESFNDLVETLSLS